MRKRLISLLLVLTMVISLGGVLSAFADNETTGETAEVTDETGGSTEGQSAESQETESQETESQEAESQETESQETESQETESQETESQEAESQEAESQEAESQETESQENAGALTSTNMLTSTEGDTSVYDDLAAQLAALAEEVYALTAEDTEALTAAYNTLLGISEAIDAALEDGSITEEQEQELGAVYEEINLYINNPDPADVLKDEDYLWENLTNPDEDETGDVTLTVVTTEGETETYQYATIMDAVIKLFSYMNHGDNYQTTDRYSASTSWYCPNGRGYNWSGVDYTWDYESAEISFTGEHCEYINTIVQFKSSDSGWVYAGLPNVTFNGNGTGSIVGETADSWDGTTWTTVMGWGYSYYMSNMEGTLVIGGDGCTVKNITFTGNHEWCFGYYCYDQAIRVSNGASNLTVENNTFQKYTLVTNFGEDNQTVSGITFKNNTIQNCLYGLITCDKGVTDLTFTGNTLIGSADSTLTSCLEWTNLLDFSGNTLIYASFGLRNGSASMLQYLNQNTYDHGFLFDDTIVGHGEVGATEWYYAACTTTVMTVLPEACTAVWTSDYNTAGYATNYITMPSTLTYTQQDAINDACETSEDPTYAILTWTSNVNEDGVLITEANAVENGCTLQTDSNGKTYIVDAEGNMLHTGTGIGKNYSSMHLDYAYSYVDVTVTKEWDDAEDQDGIRPESVTVALVKNGETTDKTVTLSEENNWTASFEKLPQYANSKEIEYTVEEVSIDGYTTEITGSAAAGYTVTNSHTPETTSVTVTKAWDDGDDQDGLQPESVTVTLYAGGTEAATATLNGDNGWTYTFTGLAKYSAGTEIEYTVEEAAVTGYTSVITGSAAEGYVITNSHTPEQTTEETATPSPTPTDEPTETPTETEPTDPGTSATPVVVTPVPTGTAPTTGDESNALLWLGLLLLCACGAAAVTIVRKRKDQ